MGSSYPVWSSIGYQYHYTEKPLGNSTSSLPLSFYHSIEIFSIRVREKLDKIGFQAQGVRWRFKTTEFWNNKPFEFVINWIFWIMKHIPSLSRYLFSLLPGIRSIMYSMNIQGNILTGPLHSCMLRSMQFYFYVMQCIQLDLLYKHNVINPYIPHKRSEIPE